MKQHETADNSQGQLYIVPTPIGNLSDITQRALTVLQAVDLIAAEDTRHTGLLLQHFAINARLFALHDHNEQQKAETLVAKLKEGQNIALVSDAGTPLINDPGYHLVRTCREAGIRVVPLPGPCAAIAALSAAGLPSDRFCYEGFLPAKSKGRRDVLKDLEAEPRTLIFYESTHRLLESLEDMVTVWGEARYVVLARELTKTWETIHGAPVGELLAWVKEDENRRKGEMVKMESAGERVNLEFNMPSRGIIGLRTNVLTASAGEAIMAHRFKEYQPYKGEIERRTNGSIIAMESGTAFAYAIDKLQDRGKFFIFPQEEVYAGQVVGEHSHDNDLVVNVTKSKKLTNMRASGSDEKARLIPPVQFSLEEALEYIKGDEYVEVTPKSMRMRKVILDETERKRANKN